MPWTKGFGAWGITNTVLPLSELILMADPGAVKTGAASSAASDFARAAVETDPVVPALLDAAGLAVELELELEHAATVRARTLTVAARAALLRCFIYRSW
jgi:hypothetical protein